MAAAASSFPERRRERRVGGGAGRQVRTWRCRWARGAGGGAEAGQGRPTCLVQPPLTCRGRRETKGGGGQRRPCPGRPGPGGVWRPCINSSAATWGGSAGARRCGCAALFIAGRWSQQLNKSPNEKRVGWRCAGSSSRCGVLQRGLKSCPDSCLKCIAYSVL